MSSQQEQRDHEIAVQLQQSFENELDLNRPPAYCNENSLSPPHPPSTLRVLSGMISKPFTNEPEKHYDNQDLSEMGYSYPQTVHRETNPSYAHREPSQSRFDSIFQRNRSEASKSPVNNDSALARALQAMEFEIADETLEAREGANRADR
jgi:hypothetical protein